MKAFLSFLSRRVKDLLQRFAGDNRWVDQNYIFVDVQTAFPLALEEQGKSQPPLTYDEVSSLVVDLLSINQTTRKDHTGLVAAARVALAGYPRLQQVVETLLRRG